MTGQDLLLKDELGNTLRVVGSDKEGPLPAGASFEVVVSSPEMLILQRVGEEEGASRAGRILMAGEVVSHTTVLDIVNVISASRWAGSLNVYGADSHRTLTFDKGALQSATSNHPDDRLNKVLVRMGVMTAASVESVMRSLQPPARLGTCGSRIPKGRPTVCIRAVDRSRLRDSQLPSRSTVTCWSRAIRASRAPGLTCNH